jgi:hypothetical protein
VYFSEKCTSLEDLKALGRSTKLVSTRQDPEEQEEDFKVQPYSVRGLVDTRYPCQCLTTDSLPRGYPGQLFGLRCVVELDGERRDSQFILVRALNR